MNTPGFIRKIDDLGRVVIPSQVRRRLQLRPGDELELCMQDDRVILRKFVPNCIFCGSDQGLMSYEGKNICESCVRVIKNA